MNLAAPGLPGNFGSRQAQYCPEAKALFARFSTKPTARRKRAIDRLVRALMQAGIWQTRDFLYMFAAADTQAATRNWIADAYNATLTSAPTFAADQGYTTNGTSNSINSNFDPSTAGGHLTRNDMSFGFWSLTPGIVATSVAGWVVSGSGISIVARSTNDIMSARVNTASVISSANGTVTDGTGPRGIARDTSTSLSLRAGGIEIATAATASAALAAGTLKFGSAVTAGYAALTFADGHAGGYLTPAQEAAFAAARATYLSAVGAI